MQLGTGIRRARGFRFGPCLRRGLGRIGRAYHVRGTDATEEAHSTRFCRWAPLGEEISEVQIVGRKEIGKRSVRRRPYSCGHCVPSRRRQAYQVPYRGRLLSGSHTRESRAMHFAPRSTSAQSRSMSPRECHWMQCHWILHVGETRRHERSEAELVGAIPFKIGPNTKLVLRGLFHSWR